MSDRRTFDVPTPVLIELRFKGCTCLPVGCEIDTDHGTTRFVVHAETCHLLWLRKAQWN